MITPMLWAGFAIGFAWLWVATWQWILIYKSLQMMGKNPKMNTFFLTVTILWIALVESAAIYWLIVALQILGHESLDWLTAIWIWLSVWLAGLWVWIWEWKMVWGAVEAMNVNPENKNKIMTYMILFLALVESAAIYGLIISLQMLGNADISWYQAIGAWLAIWLAGLWVWVWEWMLAEKSMYFMWRNFKMAGFFLTVTILGIALVESAAIYGLVVALSILGKDATIWLAAVGAWSAIWLTWLGAWIWEWVLVWWAMDAMSRNPKNKNKILVFMVLFLALVEVIAIYGMIIAFSILG